MKVSHPSIDLIQLAAFITTMVKVEYDNCNLTHPGITQRSPNSRNMQSKTFELDATQVILQHPFTMLVAGPNFSGKTYWVNRLLQHRRYMITPPVEEILWYHGQRQFHATLQDTYPTLQLINGLPDMEGYNAAIPRIIFIDDLMNQLKGVVVANLFTKGSHHTNSSIIFIVQNLFSQHREMRDISLNAHYLTIIKKPRDKQQVTTLDSQMFSGRGRFLTQCYENATQMLTDICS